MKGATVLVFLAMWPATALAGLTEAQVRQVSLSPSPGARVPTALVFKDLNGRDVSLGDAIAGHPTLLLPADFTCTQICGPALSIAASALGQTGLRRAANMKRPTPANRLRKPDSISGGNDSSDRCTAM